MGSYDITFCCDKDCKRKDCRRHLDNVKGLNILISVADFSKNCELKERND